MKDKFAHKNTGVKYKTAELTVEEARRTNARAYKYENSFWFMSISSKSLIS